MTEDKTGNPREYRKSLKKYDIVIDKTKIIAAIVCVVGMTAGMLFIFYLAGVF